MAILLGVLPIVVFVLVGRAVGTQAGRIGGAPVAIGLVLRDALSARRSVWRISQGHWRC